MEDEDYTYEEEYTYEEDNEYENDNDSRKNYDEESDENNSFPVTPGSGDKRSSLESRKDVPNDGYSIMDSSDIKHLMLSLIEDVASLLDISSDESECLLLLNRWDKEKLIDSFFANPEKVKKTAGLDLYSPDILTDILERKYESKDEGKHENFKCRICCDESCNLKNSTKMGCAHSFCNPCYGEYLRSQVNDGQTCIMTRCPEFKCNQMITRGVFKAFLNKDAALSYDRYYLRNFIENSKNMRYCPAPACEKVAIGSGITSIRCSCSYCFCFRCGEEAHDPCSCTQLGEWALKCVNESETANWILANTRKCPACNARIEKNQGCNHMTCRMCKHEFCWICMGTWSDHGQSTGGFYKCNKFVATGSSSGSSSSSANAAQSAVERAKAELDRYLHYYKRYHGHDQALRFAANLRQSAEQRMIEKQETSKSSWIDVQFLKQATEQVINCRRVLKHTYVLGYYLEEESPEKQLFEHHQEMLEKNTERLQEYTEKSLDLIDRTQVVNLTRVTEKFMASLLANMTGGVITMYDDNDNKSSGNNSSSTSAPDSMKDNSSDKNNSRSTISKRTTRSSVAK